MAGLAQVKAGTKVWLMMYYSVSSIPRTMQRTTSYEIRYQGKTIFKVAYKGTAKRGEAGQFSRYAEYNVPRSLPSGAYVYRADLMIGGQMRSRSWKFKIGNRNVLAPASARG
jgi:hypothetical protein